MDVDTEALERLVRSLADDLEELRGQRDEARAQLTEIRNKLIDAAVADYLADRAARTEQAQPDQTTPTDRPPSISWAYPLGADQGAPGAILAGRWCRSVGPGDMVCEGYEGHPGEHWRVEHADENLRSWHDESAPADPAGLDAAIEAARRSAHGVVWLDDAGQDQTIRIAVRAAAPHLRAAALNEAADEWVAIEEAHPDSIVAKWLRERAGRIGGGE